MYTCFLCVRPPSFLILPTMHVRLYLWQTFCAPKFTNCCDCMFNYLPEYLFLKLVDKFPFSEYVVCNLLLVC